MSDLTILMKATNFAAIKHKDQRRKDTEGTPYINHPIGVANYLTQAGVTDLDVIQAALLHDTVEDTETTLEELKIHFGEKVASIVAEVTDEKGQEKHERKRLQIIHARHASKEAKLVKLADKLYNIKDLERCLPTGWTNERRDEYFKWAAKVVSGCRGTNLELENQIDEVLTRNGLVNPKEIVLEANEMD
ncbi:guanosine-3',5'-bis(diphosphate) 3'-pyrophosphohydrolase MESH1 [Eurytemora carolleeae]|uniref:guanosine-3',5'-bis(diphosphate) 3'-pyrophosphohydrolase MESH1 n=1 Tax=Eurytemora carolleeae TaxID=1294199 RepID=UPI000C78B80C|nr:guanosine-3',5'-bis(diphosphate) 3'-pyrophosphohydrolase MESH1 [Eurytemora carolleeae]|eukprot:XP_023330134.1 guanosine-3',5'-bis(diphosphate) 3'-pyrophosphohydrolase MESH1-like [Eurytemora affinis]